MYVRPADADLIRDSDTLALCGGMKRYQLLDFPIAPVVKMSLRPVHRPRPPFLVDVRPLSCRLAASSPSHWPPPRSPPRSGAWVPRSPVPPPPRPRPPARAPWRSFSSLVCVLVSPCSFA
jgi:hypothetical protein